MDKAAVHFIQYICLLLSVLVSYIIEENGKLAYTCTIQGIEFGDECGQIRFAIGSFKAHIEAGRNGKNKFYIVLTCCLNQLLETLHFFGRIGLPPFFTMIGIILWSIDVQVQIMLMHEFQR